MTLTEFRDEVKKVLADKNTAIWVEAELRHDGTFRYEAYVTVDFGTCELFRGSSVAEVLLKVRAHYSPVSQTHDMEIES